MMPAGMAIVLLTLDDREIARPAALVYRTRKGLGWLEPGYYDPFPTGRPQWHEFEGTVTDVDGGVSLDGDGVSALVLDFERVRGDPYLDRPELHVNFDWLAAQLRETGKTLAQERIEVASQIEGVIP